MVVASHVAYGYGAVLDVTALRPSVPSDQSIPAERRLLRVQPGCGSSVQRVSTVASLYPLTCTYIVNYGILQT